MTELPFDVLWGRTVSAALEEADNTQDTFRMAGVPAASLDDDFRRLFAGVIARLPDVFSDMEGEHPFSEPQLAAAMLAHALGFLTGAVWATSGGKPQVIVAQIEKTSPRSDDTIGAPNAKLRRVRRHSGRRLR